jgi:hypothetical protein
MAAIFKQPPPRPASPEAPEAEQGVIENDSLNCRRGARVGFRTRA